MKIDPASVPERFRHDIAPGETWGEFLDRHRAGMAPPVPVEAMAAFVRSVPGWDVVDVEPEVSARKRNAVWAAPIGSCLLQVGQPPDFTALVQSSGVKQLASKRSQRLGP